MVTRHTVGSFAILVPVTAVWLSVVASFVLLADRDQPKELNPSVLPPAPRSTACSAVGCSTRRRPRANARNPALAMPKKSPDRKARANAGPGRSGANVSQLKNAAGWLR